MTQVREPTERVRHSLHDAAGRQQIVALLNALVDDRGGRPGVR
jgi:hypothetical protein